MAIPYGMTANNLTQIITKTSDAISEMNQLNRAVTSNTEQLSTANVSASGKLLTGNLTTWASDFNTVVNLLSELNTKATQLYQINQATDTAAASTAR